MAEDLDDTQQMEGEAMIVATSMLIPPKSVTAIKGIPRTIEWGHAIITGVIAFFVMILAVMIFGPTINTFVYSLVLGGVIGFILPSLSPLEGESLLTWFGLQGRTAVAKKVNVNGRKARMYIGTYPLKRTAQGKTKFLPSGLNVKAYKYDERGYPQMTTSSTEELAKQRDLRRQRSRGKNALKPSTSLSGMESSESLMEKQTKSLKRSKPNKALDPSKPVRGRKKSKKQKKRERQLLGMKPS